MLRQNFFRNAGNPRRVPLTQCTNFNAAVGATFNVGGIKYSGNRYFVWGEGTGPVFSGYSVIATSPDLISWVSTAVSGTIYDIACNGTEVIAVGVAGVTSTIFKFSTALTPPITYTPAGLTAPRYVEWCSGFSRFIVSAATNRAYSNDATGSTWTVASYPSSALAPECLIYSAALNKYFDVRMSTVSGGTYIVYSGTSASACTNFMSPGGTTGYTYTDAKIFYKPSNTNLVLISRVIGPTGTQFQVGEEYNSSTAAWVGGNTVALPISSFVGAAYFPFYDLTVIRDTLGRLHTMKITLPTTLTVVQNYNSNYPLNTTSTTYTQDSNRLIAAPAGLVTADDPGNIFFTP